MKENIYLMGLLLGIILLITSVYCSLTWLYRTSSNDQHIENGKQKAIVEFYENIGYEQKMKELQQAEQNIQQQGN